MLKISLCFQPFGDILGLVPKAESIVKLSAVCIVCNEDAAFTRRFSPETAVGSPLPRSIPMRSISEFQVELIGGSDKYMAVCRECYTKELPQEYGKLPDSEVKVRCSPMKRQREEHSVNGDTTNVVRKLF